MGIISKLTGRDKKRKDKAQIEADLKAASETSSSKPKTYLQKQTLKRMEPYTVVEIHADGDLTIECDGSMWIVCADGRSFQEKKFKTY